MTYSFKVTYCKEEEFRHSWHPEHFTVRIRAKSKEDAEKKFSLKYPGMVVIYIG